MSGFLLDTNIPSELSHPRPEPKVIEWLNSVEESLVYLSVITLGELRKGCELLHPGKRRDNLEEWLNVEIRNWFADRILPLDDTIAERWGKLEAKRQRLGMLLNTADGQIAATALCHGLTIVTHNVRDFSELGVQIFDPWTKAAC